MGKEARYSNAPRPRRRIAGAILAGGEASRYGGVAKGMLPLPNGQPMIDRIIGKVASARIDPIVIMANDPAPYSRCGRRILPDRVPGQGPLGGIATALAHFEASHDAVLFMPCDLPGIGSAQVGALCDAFARGAAPIVAARTGPEQWHPLCAVVAAGLGSEIEHRASRPRDRRVRSVWFELGVEPVDFADTEPFFNVNTPEQMCEWERISAGAGAL